MEWHSNNKRFAFQGHNGLDGLKGQPGAPGVKVNTKPEHCCCGCFKLTVIPHDHQKGYF